MKIAIDFDGTCVTDKFPYVGEEIGAAPVLKALVDAGHQLILYTMRSNKQQSPTSLRSVLGDALRWFESHNITLWSVNKDRNQEQWTDSPKCHADLCIDDRNIGTPLRYKLYGKPYVDWEKMQQILCEMNIIPSR